MTTSRHDLAHGRHGGRVVDWRKMAHPIPVGATRTLDLGDVSEGAMTVTVLEHLPADRLRVGLPAGADLIVRPYHLTERDA